MPRILIEVDGLDPQTNARVTLRAASADDRRITNLNGQKWWPAITRLPSLSWDGFDGDYTGEISVGTATFELNLPALKRQNANLPRFRWAAAPVRIYVGEAGAAWAAWEQKFVGIVDSFDIKSGTLQITARVDTSPFEVPVLVSTYAGTGGIEGGADLKNKPKPLSLGRCRNIEPVLIDAVNNVYQVSGYGAVSGITAVYERASDFGASVGDYGSYSALVAASIPAGRWATCHAFGLFRLGAPAAGVITADVNGDTVSGFVQTTSAVIQRMCAIAGVSTSAIDATSFSTFATAVPYPINIYVTEQTELLELNQRLVRPCNASAAVSWTGKLFVARFASIPSPSATLDVKGRRRPAVLEVAEASVRPPYSRIEMQADRSWRVHSFEEVAFYADLIDLGDYSGGTTYREGNIVRQPVDGCRYLYINPTPTAGNAPPNGTYWALYEEPPDITTVSGLGALAGQDEAVSRATTPPFPGFKGMGWVSPITGQLHINQGLGLFFGGTEITFGGQSVDIPWVLSRDAANTNFDKRNDRLSAVIDAPTIPTDGTAVDHTINTDGSADISFEWAWGGDEAMIDGFEVVVYSSTSSGAYAIGSNPGAEQLLSVPANKRAFILQGVPADRHFTWGVRAYRVVDPDVNTTGVIRSAVSQPSASGENPYRPSSSVAFAGNITGTIDGVGATAVAAGAQAANSGLNGDGTVKANKVSTTALITNAATNLTAAYTVGAQALFGSGGTWYTIQSVTISDPSGQPIQLIGFFLLFCTGSGGSLSQRLLRSQGGVDTEVYFEGLGDSGAFATGTYNPKVATAIVDQPSAGVSVTYSVQIKSDIALTSGSQATRRNLMAFEAKR